MRGRATAVLVAAVAIAAPIAVAGGGEKTVRETRTSDTGTVKVDASCPNGLAAVSGGFKGRTGDQTVVVTKRSLRQPKRTWEAGEQRLGTEEERLTVFGYCAAEQVTTRERTRTLPDSSGLPPPTTTVAVRCPRGETPISGGYTGALPSSPYVSGSRRAGTRKWAVTFVSYDKGADGTAQANCYDGPPLDSVKKRKTLPADSPPGRFIVTAKCPKGETAISGGFKSSVGVTEYGPLIFMSRRKGERKWAVGYVQGNYDFATRFKAYAYCA